MYFLIQSLFFKKKVLGNYIPSLFNTFANEGITRKSENIKQQIELDRLPIKVNKINNETNELEKKKKLLSLPSTTIPFISEVVTAFYPVIQDSQNFKVEFTSGMMEQLKNGTAKIMEAKDGTGYRGMAIAAEGKPVIKEHAKLIQNIDPALVLNASFQLASIVVAQQHMQQINQSLKYIKRQLDDIKKLHMNEYLFHAKGNIDYFEVRVIPHFQANGSFDWAIKNQAELRFNTTMDMLPSILSLQLDLLRKVESVKDSVYFGNIFVEEAEVTKLKQILNEYSEHQEIIDLYLKWLNEMYVPYLSVAGYSETEIRAVVSKIKVLEDKNILSYQKISQKINKWADSFKIKLFRINEKSYIEKSTCAVMAALPHPVTQSRTKPIIDGINQPLEIIVEYLDKNKINTYLIET